VNEQGKSINELWDGENLKFTFRRTMNQEVMNRWYQLLEITSSLQLGEEENAIIWQYNSSAVYSVKSLYAIVNKGGGGSNKCIPW
jgi:hypothetical protein